MSPEYSLNDASGGTYTQNALQAIFHTLTIGRNYCGDAQQTSGLWLTVAGYSYSVVTLLNYEILVHCKRIVHCALYHAIVAALPSD